MPLAPHEEDVVRKYLAEKYGLDEPSLIESQRVASEDRLQNNLASAATKFGSAIAGVKPDVTGFDELNKQSDASHGSVRDYLMQKYKIGREAADRELEGKKLDRSLQMDEETRRHNQVMEANTTKKTDAYLDALKNPKPSAATVAAEQKSKNSVREIEERSQNIQSNISKLSSMIDEKGTWEALGSHNQDLERLVDQIAVDTAKLMDPESVARPGEVELVKRSLVQAGFRNSNATAKKVLENFGKEMEGRVQNAYRVRGLGRDPKNEVSGSKTPLKKFHNKAANKTKVVYSDGSEEILDGLQ